MVTLFYLFGHRCFLRKLVLIEDIVVFSLSQKNKQQQKKTESKAFKYLQKEQNEGPDLKTKK